MTAKMTLEEIEAEIVKLGDQRWYGKAHTLRLLEIAQEMRAEIKRLREELGEANECRDPAYFAQLGRKRKR